jgi:hypothetical protein
MIKKILTKMEYRGINVRDFSVAVCAMLFLASMITFCIVGLISSSCA